jgi:pimeloyl-ACP methyl ester carboxylesterase
MFERRMVEVEDTTLEVFVGGRGGPALCLAHNFDVLTAEGGLALRPLSRIGRTFGVNLRSMGGSSAEPERSRLSMAQAVLDLEALRHKLGVGPWVFVGFSAGGFIGIRYALQFPEGLAGLVLVGTAPSFRVFLDPRSIYCRANPSFERAQAAAGTQQWSEIVWPLISRDPALVARNAKHGGGISESRQAAQVAEMRDYDFEKQLAEISLPTLVIHGRYDTSMPLAHGELIAAKVPGARLEIFERSGHFPFWEEEADFERVVREFSQGVRSTPPAK